LSIVAEVKKINISLSFHAHKDTSVTILKGYIIEKLIERNQNKFSYLKNEHLLILFKSSILVDENTLGNYEFDSAAENLIQIIISKENEIQAENDTYNNKTQTNNGEINKIKEQEAKKLQYYHKLGENSHSHQKRNRKKSKSSEGKENLNRNSNNFNNEMLIESEEIKDKVICDDYFPRFNNEFNLFPSIQYIYRMKKSDLESIEGLEISNHFGKIKFKSKIDLTYLNLSEIVKIDLFTIELYPETEMPKPGEGLNKPAVITINQMFDQRDNLKDLIQSVKEKGGKFIGYDEYKGKFKFEVDKWIK